MADYNWVATPKGDLVEYTLINNEFREFIYPIIRRLDNLLEEKLKAAGFTCYYDKVNNYYKAYPNDLTLTEVTAPLFELRNGEYIKIADSFTSKTLHPDKYVEFNKAVKKCRKELVEEQTKIFDKLYSENSLDGGLTSCIIIGEDGFNKHYIPEGYLIIAQLNCSDTKQKVVLIKKQYFCEDRITIKVPDDMKSLVLGPGGENIKKIAKKLHIYYIHVE